MKNSIPFEYPIVLFDAEDPDESQVIAGKAAVTPIQLGHEPFEMGLTARGYYYHLIFGHQTNGGFLCIPNWNVGCEIAELNNKSWNMDSLLDCNGSLLEYEDASAITYALDLASDLVG